jgi:polyhydroxyalkanoate synthesis regulator phasin
MFEIVQIIEKASIVGQVPVTPNTEIAEDASLVFNNSQFFAAAIAGVILAFAFQFLFTNLGVAAWISTMGKSSSDRDRSESDDFGSSVRKVSVKLGIATLISVTLSLFFACLLAVRLGLFVSSISGAIVGLTIWGIFFLLLVWVSSTTVGSFVGSVMSTATSGLQTLIGTVTAAVGAKSASKQVVETAEAAAAAVKRELGTGLDPMSLRERLEDYIDAIKPPSLDVNRIATDFERLLDDENLQEIAASGNLQNIDRQTFLNLIANRSDLSKKDLDRIADKLERVWRKRVERMPRSQNPISSLTDYFKSAPRERLLGKDLNNKLDELIQEMRQNQNSQPSGGGGGAAGAAAVGGTSAIGMGLNSIIGLVMGRTDLSDFDVDKIISQIQSLKGTVGEQTNKVAAQVGIKETLPSSRIRADIENYLENASSWQLSKENLVREFRDVLYDPEADPAAVIDELQRLSRADFAAILQQKGLYTQDKIRAIVEILDAIRWEVVAVAENALEREKAIVTLAEVENYLLLTPKENFAPGRIQNDFKSILQNSGSDYQFANERLKQFDRLTFERIFAKRQDISAVEASALINELELALERVLQETQQENAAAEIKLEAQWAKLYAYLREADKSQLTPQKVRQELKSFLDEEQAEATTLRMRRAYFDRHSLVSLLEERKHLTTEEINAIVDEIELVWLSYRHQSPQLVAKTQEQYARATSAISDYLRGAKLEELNSEGIKQALGALLNDPKASFRAISNSLTSIDRDTLIQLLVRRGDLSQEQANRIVDEVQVNLQSFARMPRRLARRTQEKVYNFQEAISNYLRSTDKEELNPDGIKRDLQLLLNDPRAGMGSLQERLSHFDRETLVALLSQREDISREDVDRIIDQVLSVREQMMQQLQTMQDKVQSAIERIFIKIRDYLNSLERPELNYDGISHDIRSLLDDPKAGFEALRDRLSQFDRETLVALISSREDISRADAERIIGQVERTRTRVLQRAERIQQEAKLRLEQVKHEAVKQAEETRKAAAVASWWLFATATISAIASAFAGYIGAID